MTALGQTQKSGRAAGKSALPSKTDIVGMAYQVREVPRQTKKAATFDAVWRFGGHHTHPYVSGSDVKNVL
jgi:hypothetical protein